MTTKAPIVRVTAEGLEELVDTVAGEEPLEIRLSHGPIDNRQQVEVALTMRTPGYESDLAIGFLAGEQIIQGVGDLLDVVVSSNRSRVRIDLHPRVSFDPRRLERNFYLSSSCGVCGKVSAQGLRHVSCRPSTVQVRFQREILFELPAELRGAQAAFAETGGLHAAAVFDARAGLVLLREDVGRHNAVDKIVGAALRERIGLADKILLVSGRASFELAQKAVVAGFPLLAAIGAPSSLAVETAEATDLTLVGFLSRGRFNIYASGWRLL